MLLPWAPASEKTPATSPAGRVSGARRARSAARASSTADRPLTRGRRRRERRHGQRRGQGQSACADGPRDGCVSFHATRLARGRRVRPSARGVDCAPPWGERFHRLGGLRRYRLPVAGTPLRPHLATPTELRDRLRAEAAACAVPRPARRGRPAARRRARRRARRSSRSGATRRPTWRWRGTRGVAHPRDARAARAATGRSADDGLSRNGTWVNEERVTARRRLRDGDVVRVGGTSLAFCAPGRARARTRRSPPRACRSATS